MISIPLFDRRPFNSWFSWFCSGLSLRKLWLGLMFSSVSELLALELSSIIVAGLASIEAFSWTEFDDILRGTSGSLAAGGGACSDSESESETEAAEAAEDLRTSAMTSAFWASSRWTVSRFELTISSFVNSSFLYLQVIFYEIGTLFLQQNHNMVSTNYTFKFLTSIWQLDEEILKMWNKYIKMILWLFESIARREKKKFC